MIIPRYLGETALIIGTGPSLTRDVIDLCNASTLKKFGVNNVWQVIDLDVFHACNDFYFTEYWNKGLSEIRAEQWTNHPDIVKQCPGTKYIKHHPNNEQPGLSRDRSYTHRHHGSGPQMLNIAYHYGIKTMLLVGWDMHYPGKIDRHNYSKPRHFFGDDICSGKHFPMTGNQGEFTGLIKEVCSIHPEDYNIEIYNCTPGSALTCFPMMHLRDALTIYDKGVNLWRA